MTFAEYEKLLRACKTNQEMEVVAEVFNKQNGFEPSLTYKEWVMAGKPTE